MTGGHIDLNRKFRPASKDDDEPYSYFFRASGGYLSWSDLLEMSRVVVLAEAGSGKSAEFEHQRDALVAEGKLAVMASVSQVARVGLERALASSDRAKLHAWHRSSTDLCWFFIDSVDEAKDQDHHFDDAARELADAIAGREERARLIISSRFTDWDAAADRRTMEKRLLLPPAAPPPAPFFEDEVKATLRNDSKVEKAEPSEPVQVLRMAGLDRDRVKLFAEGSGIGDADRLLDAIEDNDLWRFAARPLDLTWMVRFWQKHRGLGTLREMLEESLAARLIDPDPKRRRRDTLEGVRSAEALDRIGAAFLFCGKDSLSVPTSELDLAPAERSVPIEQVLPDWPDTDRLLLLGRSVFDPATLGRAQLHNDNEGTMRCYLAARWLNRLLEQNCPIQTVRDILFADLYGYRLVRPDMVDTATWLAAIHPAIANELTVRAPLALLLNGDPGSLPIPTRIKAFTAVIAQIGDIDREKMWFMDRNLKRFADPALDAHIEAWWRQAAEDAEAQHLVLRLARLGKYRAGLVIARTTAVDRDKDETTQLLAARLIIELGDDVDKRRLAEHIMAHRGALRRSLVLEALAGLTPKFFSIDDFFAAIAAVGVRDSGGLNSIRPIDTELIDVLSEQADLSAFVTHVVAGCGPLRGKGEEGAEASFREAFANVGAAAAVKLLRHHHPDQVPDAVTHLALLLNEARRLSDADVSLGALTREFATSPGRRQSSYWRAVELARAHPWNHGSHDVNVWMLNHLGWTVALDISDLDWLLADVGQKSAAIDRLNALTAAFQVWRQNGEDLAVLERIRTAVHSDTALSAQVGTWLAPSVEDPAIAKHTAQFEALQRRNDEREKTRDDSWVELIAKLRDDPSIFDDLNPTTEETVDSRLYHLWQFTSWRGGNRSRYAIDSLDLVEPILGAELTKKFADALIAFAYERARTDRTAPKAGEQKSETTFDLMALGGMSLAAAKTPDWASGLPMERAREAARLAALELNGFPKYLTELATAQPDIVRQMILRQALAQLAAANPEAHGMLDRLEYAEPSLSLLITDDLVANLTNSPGITAPMLEKVVSVLIRAMPRDVTALEGLARERAATAADPVIVAYYLILLFAAVGDRAIDALRAKMAVVGPADQTVICSALFPRIVGGRFNRGAVVRQEFSVAALKEMLILAFEGIRMSEDIKHPDGQAYSIGERDEAEEARNAIFHRIVATSGEATQAVLRELMAIPDFPIEAKWIAIHAMRHAERDAELAAWSPEDVISMEKEHERAPVTTADLQLLAVRRLEALRHDLFHHKFAQGDTLQAMADEDAVQRWTATQLEARQACSYTVQRETELTESKAPDILLTSRHSGVELPIEIKVVDKMTVAEIEAALETQLCGQYLRHREARHGILLLVLQKLRQGWKIGTGGPLVSLTAVVAHLEGKAQAIRERSVSGPQPVVVAIDVSSIVPLEEKRAAARAKTKSKNNADLAHPTAA